MPDIKIGWDEFGNVSVEKLSSDVGGISDGYHTFDELYEHRIRLYIIICKWLGNNVWASTLHSDGSSFGDWFILGMGKAPGEQITYHLPARFWNEVCEFAEILDRAPEWDGHTSTDVIERLQKLFYYE